MSVSDAHTYIYGRHAVRALIEREPRRIKALYLAQSTEQEFKPLALKASVRSEPFPKNQFMSEIGGVVHQGIVAKVSIDGLLKDYTKFFDELEPSPETSIVLLNEISDPHNMGAIIRSAAGFGASAVLIPAHDQAGITGTVAKASAGMIFEIPLIQIGNENQAIIDLKKRGYWIYGLAGEGTHSIHTEKFDAPAVFVVGSEGEGMREKTREHCDILLSIPLHSRTESLNASVAAAVALSAWSAQHPGALQPQA